MERQVQERIGRTALGRPVALAMSPGLFDDRVVLRMHRDDLDDVLLEAAQWLARPKFRPGIGHEPARFVACGCEHVSPDGPPRGTDSPPRGAATEGSLGVVSSESRWAAPRD